MLDTEKVDPKGLPVQVATVRIYLHCARFLPRAGGGPGVQSVGGSRSTKAITAKVVGSAARGLPHEAARGTSTASGYALGVPPDTASR